MPENDNFKLLLDNIEGSDSTDQEKIGAISDLIANLNLLNQNTEVCMATERGAVIAKKANRPEMAAQFCLMRAKSEIAQAGMLIAEMRNLTTAIDWFGFALESAEKQYKTLEKKLNSIWSTTQALIDTGYKLLNERPIVGAVAYCHNTAGQIYGSHYLQLKLYYFKGGRPWRSRFGNYNLMRWLDLDDLFVIEKKSRVHLRKVRKDCIRSLHLALKLFRQDKAYQYIVDTYLDLCLEHHSFNSPVRSKYYYFLSKILIRVYHLQNNQYLKKRIITLSDMPLIGSNRTERVTDILPELELDPELDIKLFP